MKNTYLHYDRKEREKTKATLVKNIKNKQVAKKATEKINRLDTLTEERAANLPLLVY